MSIALAGPEPPCSYCGQPFSVEPALASTIAELRQTIAGRAAAAEQLIGRQARLGREHGLGVLIPPLSVWLLATFTIFGMIDTPGVSIGELLSRPGPGDPTYKAWLLTALAAALGIVLIGFGVAVIRARGVVRRAFPRPPVADGRPPRCRVCNGELGEDGQVRQCGYCGADNLVLGRYQEADRELAAALAARRRELDKTLEARSRAVWRTVTIGTWLSLAVVLGSWVVLLLGPFRPAAFYAAAGAVGLGALLVAIGMLRPIPKIRTLSEALAGDRLVIDGEELTVLGSMTLPAPADGQPGYKMIAARSDGGATMAFDEPIPDEGDLTYLPLTPGGAPFEAAEAGALIELSVSRQVDTGPLAGATPFGLWRGGDAAVWLGRPAPGAAPLFSASTPRRKPRADVAFRTAVSQ